MTIEARSSASHQGTHAAKHTHLWQLLHARNFAKVIRYLGAVQRRKSYRRGNERAGRWGEAEMTSRRKRWEGEGRKLGRRAARARDDCWAHPPQDNS